MNLPAVRLHALAVAVAVAIVVAHHVVVHSGRERRRAEGAALLWLAVTTWPIGDLAAGVSLSVATLQRLVIMLGVAPLAIASVPLTLWVRVTRPAPLDAVASRLAHPGVALVVVSLVGTASLMPVVVDAGAHSSIGRTLVLGLTIVAGVELWLPILAPIPGARHLSALARSGFLFAASLTVTSLSFVWIFAHHSLYPALTGQRKFLGISPLADQQVAGFLAKLGAYLPMWAVAFTIFSRADRVGEVESSPLHWADVERHLERADRRAARARRHRVG